MTLRKLAILLTGVLVAAVTAIAIIAAGSDIEVHKEIRIEITKSLLELSIIVIIGGIVAALFKSLDFARESAARNREELARKAQLRAKIQEEYLRRLGLQYRAVKSCRRALRVAGLTSKHELPKHLTRDQCVALEEEMRRVNTAQLEIEGMMIESESLSVFMEVKDLATLLHTMEDYLRDLLLEYERWMPPLRVGAAVQFATLEKLRAFTGSTRDEGKTFLTSFADPYEKIVSRISLSISRMG
jgi:hypothetical protein